MRRTVRTGPARGPRSPVREAAAAAVRGQPALPERAGRTATRLGRSGSAWHLSGQAPVPHPRRSPRETEACAHVSALRVSRNPRAT